MRAITKIIAVSLIVAGCSASNQSVFYGTWIGHRAVQRQPGMSSGAMNTLSEVKVVIKPSGRFLWIDSGMPKKGDFYTKNGEGYLKVDTILNEPMKSQPSDVQANNVPVRLSKLKNGEIRLYDPKGFDSTGVILKKIPGKAGE